jgi:hypothetical protein
MRRPSCVEWRGKTERLLLVGAVVCLVAAGAAFGEGVPDQVNDPSRGGAYSCPSRSMFQSFAPSRRLLAAVELRIGVGPEFPSGGSTLRVQVRHASIEGAVVGASTYFLTPSVQETLVHFDFSPPAVLDPAGAYFIEWLDPPGAQAYWAGSIPGGSAYSGGTAWMCAGFGQPTINFPDVDLNFISYTPADSAPPDTKITLAPATSPPRRGTAALFEYSGSDDLSYAENLKYECALDAGAFASCGGSSFNAKTSRDGLHRFRVRAVDESRAADPTPATASWITDNTVPIVHVVQQPARGPSLSFVIAASDNVDAARQLTLSASVDSGRFARCSSLLRIAKSRHPHRIRVVAVDRAGNRSRVALLVVRNE